MVITFLQGGLGNQLFQYAIGRQLAIRQLSELKLDLSWFGDPAKQVGMTPRKFLLDNFQIHAVEATPAEVRRLRPTSGFWHAIKGVQRSISPYYWNTWLHERRWFALDARVLSVRHDVYLSGYWQHEGYFHDCEDILRQEFIPKRPLHPDTESVLSRISETDAVAIHVRRGDYAKAEPVPWGHFVCGPAYYHACIDRIRQRVPKPHFFVFSDEPEWVKANLEIPDPVEFITHNGGERPHEDLWLMRSCKHQIISSSTFSWWGAWLNTNPHKIVLAPQKWFYGELFDTSELLLRDWERL
jgi:Glycosyl transferase family 11